MVIKELYKTRKDGVNLMRVYSDAGLMIRQEETGHVYNEAIDVEDAPYTYTETEENVETEQEEEPDESELEGTL